MRKPFNNFIYVGYLASIVYGVTTIIQYWIKHPDTNEFLGNIAIAVLIFVSAYLYDKYKKIEVKVDYIEEKHQDER